MTNDANTTAVSSGSSDRGAGSGGRLSGRVAVVTGASSGIGAATARGLAAGGAAVAVLGRRQGRLEDLAEELGRTGRAAALPLAVDVVDSEAMGEAARTVRARLGPVDLVVANAGAMVGAPFAGGAVREWDRMIDVNLRGLLHTAHAFTDDLLSAAERGGAADLVLVGSVAGHLLYPDWSVYAATKAAVAHLSRNLRAELGPRGVRVRVVEPGVTVTELGADMRDETMKASLSQMRSQLRALDADDIAGAIAFSVAAPAHVNIAELVLVPVQQG
ncbi:SDR family oxidoreductase [Nocardiopsis sp. YSL2]|uniref:SDR family oxidoreductase n=1 Tax=Nocardiopsis sp. YSL2 TaxID=2939492 RepID=UPI0026F41060|nr:SDR family oxidoreductase [Nocardiopsis sp. YSL2]